MFAKWVPFHSILVIKIALKYNAGSSIKQVILSLTLLYNNMFEIHSRCSIIIPCGTISISLEQYWVMTALCSCSLSKIIIPSFHTPVPKDQNCWTLYTNCQLSSTFAFLVQGNYILDVCKTTLQALNSPLEQAEITKVMDIMDILPRELSREQNSEIGCRANIKVCLLSLIIICQANISWLPKQC